MKHHLYHVNKTPEFILNEDPLGRYTVSTAKQLPMFRRVVKAPSLQSSGQRRADVKDGGTMLLRNVVNFSKSRRGVTSQKI